MAGVGVFDRSGKEGEPVGDIFLGKTMATKSISRRDILKTLSMGAMATSVLRVIPAQAAEYAHHMVAAEKAAAATGVYTPKFFSPQQYKTLQALCQTIIPTDTDSGGAMEAGAPEFIDLLTSENPKYQLRLGGGMMWLEAQCTDRYGKAYLDCAPEQQKEILDLIAFCKNADKNPEISQGVEFFSFLREMTADGFFTSEIGIKYLGYVGNTYTLSFPGCPPVPEA
jgi:gluconate 2-dehydrogenase gamma chain